MTDSEEAFAAVHLALAAGAIVLVWRNRRASLDESPSKVFSRMVGMQWLGYAVMGLHTASSAARSDYWTIQPRDWAVQLGLFFVASPLLAALSIRRRRLRRPVSLNLSGAGPPPTRAKPSPRSAPG